MELRTDHLGVLLDQLDSSREFSQARLEGLGDEEYLWEPVPGAWSIHRRGEAPTPKAFGRGEWVLDHDSPEPDPSPFTTIAWRLGHLHSGFEGRWEWTFGSRSQDPMTLTELTPSATEALERFWALMDRWRESLASMTEEQLTKPGFGQYPYGLDPGLPFIGIIWWTNRELIHHTAEIALLRDLWRRRAKQP